MENRLNPRRTAVLLRTALLGAAAVLLMASPTAHAADKDVLVKANGERWFLVGGNLPWIKFGCDFGCGARGGVSGNERAARKHFSKMSRKGIRTVRWFAFPAAASQIRRSGSYAGGLNKQVTRDMDVAVRLAKEYDIYITFVMFTDPRKLPATWVETAKGRQRLAEALRPLVRRYRGSRHVIGWEIAHEPERALGEVSEKNLRAFVKRMARMINAQAPAANASVTSRTLGGVRRWRHLGLDYFGVTWLGTPQKGSGCPVCVSHKTLRKNWGVNRPIVVTSLKAPSASVAYYRLKKLRTKGYGGAYGWSLIRRAVPGHQSKPKLGLGGFVRMAYRGSRSGPHMGALNPCFGPAKASLRCPDMHMSPPFGLYVDRRGGKTLLRAGNSLNSIGKGPVEVFGKRLNSRWMKARQQIWRRGGGKLKLPFRGRLNFKAIPGQYRYWKFDNAARFELWKLDSSGRLAKLVRVGPKAIYCLRDLKRTRGHLKGSPGGRYYPGCNQQAGKRSVTLGTSIGWSDVYPATYHEQWINVTGLRGCFAYVHIADPKNHIFESNEDNNRSTRVVKLPYTGKAGKCAKFGKTAKAGPIVGTY